MVEDEDITLQKSKGYGFQTTASVKIDTKTGKIGGWESLFELLQKENQEFDHDFLAIDYDEANEQASKVLEKVRPGDFILKQLDPQKFLITHRDGTEYPVHLKIAVDGSGECFFEGLPMELEKPLKNFSYEEKRTNPLTVLQAVLRERE